MRKTLLLLGASLVAIASAHADSLSDRRAGREKVAEVTVEVACGRLDKENCAVVLPETNTRSVANGVRLKPLESKGSAESAQALCDGDINAAVVQADVVPFYSRKPDCAGRLAVLGPALYPYIGFMVVSAKSKATTFADLVAEVPGDRNLRIAAGGSGSGGNFTLRRMIETHPRWSTRISIMTDTADTALPEVADGQLDAFFIMDGPKSPLLATVANAHTAKGDPVYRFLDFRPDSDLLGVAAGGHPVYATMTIAPGFWSSTKSVATPAVMVVRTDWYQSNARTAAVIRQALEDANSQIATETGAPHDWKDSFQP